MKTSTSFIIPSDHRKKWYIFDCKTYQSVSFGRIATYIGQTLIGKHNPFYHPSTDVGNYVILINAEYVKFDRDLKRFHVFQPGHPGKSLKQITANVIEHYIESCIFNMLPSGFTKNNLKKRLKIYKGDRHPHTAQKLIKLGIWG